MPRIHHEVDHSDVAALDREQERRPNLSAHRPYRAGLPSMMAGETARAPPLKASATSDAPRTSGVKRGAPCRWFAAAVRQPYDGR
jgi:hypothetical protein